MKRLGAVLAILLVAACVGPPPTPDSYYRLAPGLPTQSLPRPVLGGTLQVDGILAAGIVGDTPLLYVPVDHPERLYQYNTFLWAQPPAEMLEMALTDWLRAARVAPRVAGPGVRAHPRLYVQGRLEQLEHVRGSAPRVRVTLEMSANQADGDNALLGVWRYQVTRPAASDSVDAAVAAFDQAVREVFRRFTDDLAREAL